MTREKQMYLGTNDQGERVYVSWELTKDGKFTCGAEGWMPSGRDMSWSGRITRELAEEFADNEQLFMMSRLADYHLNNMIAGSPKQMELIQNEIEPAYEALKERVYKRRDSYNSVKRAICNSLVKNRANIHHTENVLWLWFEEWFKEKIKNHEKNRKLEEAGQKFVGKSFLDTISIVYIGLKGLERWGSGGWRSMSISSRQKKILYNRDTTEVPDHYDFICKELEKRGRLVDPDFIYKDKAYRYGTAWLKEELPNEVVEEIESWTESKFTGLTPLQQACEDLGATMKYVGYDRDRDQNHFIMTINYIEFDFWAGTGIKINTVTCDQILGCVIEDARYGEDMDMAVEYCKELGYESYDEVKSLATALVAQRENLRDAGAMTTLEELELI